MLGTECSQTRLSPWRPARKATHISCLALSAARGLFEADAALGQLIPLGLLERLRGPLASRRRSLLRWR
eukprot:5513064-Pyramimonas_sp.AAC.1